MELLKQSTAATVLVGPVLDASNGAYTGAAIGDFNITKNGTTAALASAATATHSHNGMYLIALTTGNTDTLGRLVISCSKSSYRMDAWRGSVLTESTFDALVTNAAGTQGGLATLDSHLSVRSDTLYTSAVDLTLFVSASTTTYAFTSSTMTTSNAQSGGLKGRIFSIISGTGAGIDRVISNSVTATYTTLTFETAMEVAPDATSVWVIRRGRSAKLDSSLRPSVLDSNGAVLDATAIPAASVIADAVWDELQAGHTTTGTFGKYLDGQISTISVDSSAIAAAVWAAATRTLTSFNPTTVANPFIATKDLAAIPTASAHQVEWTIIDRLGNAVSLSGKTVRCVFGLVSDAGNEDDTTDDTLAASFAYETSGSGIVVSGTSNNIVTLTHDVVKTATAGQFRYWLWNITDKRLLAKGQAFIEPALQSA